ncbi:MAG: class II aldolase [Rhodobiaceae bacterium]|nr:class II aldolase [Rhodobiaceae bacterium]
MSGLAQSVIDTALTMSESGLSAGRSGNVSVRDGDRVLITPTGMAYEDLVPADIVSMGLDGSVAPESRKPSSEWHFHAAIYAARDDVSAIVHTHSNAATALACLEVGIPAFHYMVAAAGGMDIRCAPYATFGTEELATFAVAALEGRTACLLAHHGVIACGSSLGQAYELAVEVETLADQFGRARQLGEVPLLSEAEMQRVLEKFSGYGQQV